VANMVCAATGEILLRYSITSLSSCKTVQS
jgi:hypothetical protein